MTQTLDELKQLAAAHAVAQVKSGMVLGLGTGSTASHAVRQLGEALATGQLSNLIGIPTSEATAALAQSVGIPLTTLAQHPAIDLTIDGADEFDPELNLTKGLGGALLREKIVAASSKQFIVIVDETKRVSTLGERSPIPVEVIPFAEQPVTAHLKKIGARPVTRMTSDGAPYETDENNLIIDAFFDGIDNVVALAQAITNKPGVVEHGMFLDMASMVVVASQLEGITVVTSGRE